MPYKAERELLRIFHGQVACQFAFVFGHAFIVAFQAVAYAEHDQNHNKQQQRRTAYADNGEQPAVLCAFSDVAALSLRLRVFRNIIRVCFGRRCFENNVGIFSEFFYIFKHFARVLVSCLNVFAHGFHHDVFNGGRDVGNYLRRRNGLLLNLHECDGNGAVCVKREFARQHFIKNDARRIDVAAFVGGSALCLFGADVMNRAYRLVGNGYRAVILNMRDTEIHDFDGLVAIHQNDVLRFYVTVNNAAFVGVFERRKYLFDDMERVVNVKRAVLDHIFFERGTFEVFHNDILNVALEIDVENVHDILVRKHCDGSGFVEKTAAGLRLAHKFLFKNFERNKSALLRVLGFVNDAHAARADNFFDCVTTVKDGSDQSVFHI